MGEGHPVFRHGQAAGAILAEIADHPEITLCRRDITRFILVEPSKRSDEIQTLLKLDGPRHEGRANAPRHVLKLVELPFLLSSG